VIIVLLAVLPRWPYSSGWGYTPSGLVGLILLILLRGPSALASRAPGREEAPPAGRPTGPLATVAS